MSSTLMNNSVLRWVEVKNHNNLNVPTVQMFYYGLERYYKLQEFIPFVGEPGGVWVDVKIGEEG